MQQTKSQHEQNRSHLSQNMKYISVYFYENLLTWKAYLSELFFNMKFFLLFFKKESFGNFKNKQKSVSSNAFWYEKIFVFWKFIQFTKHWNKMQRLQKFPLDKINVTNNAYFFVSRPPTHHSFAFNLRCLNELKHKARISKSMCGTFHFRFRFVFIKVDIFVQQKAWIIWL